MKKIMTYLTHLTSILRRAAVEDSATVTDPATAWVPSCFLPKADLPPAGNNLYSLLSHPRPSGFIGGCFFRFQVSGLILIFLVSGLILHPSVLAAPLNLQGDLNVNGNATIATNLTVGGVISGNIASNNDYWISNDYKIDQPFGGDLEISAQGDHSLKGNTLFGLDWADGHGYFNYDLDVVRYLTIGGATRLTAATLELNQGPGGFSIFNTNTIAPPANDFLFISGGPNESSAGTFYYGPKYTGHQGNLELLAGTGTSARVVIGRGYLPGEGFINFQSSGITASVPVNISSDLSVSGALTVNGTNVATTADLTNVARTDQANTFDQGLAVSSGSSVSENDLVLHMSFDTDEGSTVADLSGNGNNGTVNGAIWESIGGVKGSGYYSFNGSSSLINIDDINNSLDLANGYFTVVAWVRPKGNYSLPRPIVSKWDDASGNNRTWYLSLYHSAEYTGFPLAAWSWNGLGYTPTLDNYNVAYGASALPLDQPEWMQVAVVVQPESASMFLNGVAGGTLAKDLYPTGVFATDKPVLIGAGDFGGTRQYFQGDIDEVRVYNRALSSTEIAQLYQGSSQVILATDGKAIEATGDSTFNGGVDVNGHLLANNLSVSGASTFTGVNYNVSIGSEANALSISGKSDFSDTIYTPSIGLKYQDQVLGMVPRTAGSGFGFWASVASSADGMNLFAGRDWDCIYKSIDAGLNWVELTSSGDHSWWAIACSADGTKLVGADCNSGYIYTSTDSGATWTERTGTGTGYRYGLASSADGMKLAATTYQGYIFTSVDGGVNWVQRTSGNWLKIASSSDGSVLLAQNYPGYMRKSSDGGANWSTLTSAGSRYWWGIDCSDDGQTIVAAADGGYLYQSLNGGTSWTEISSLGTKSWRSVSCSTDGSTVYACAEGSLVYVSSDFGTTWSAVYDPHGNHAWYDVACSADGSKVVAVPYSASDYIHTLGLITVNKTQVVSRADLLLTDGSTTMSGDFKLAGNDIQDAGNVSISGSLSASGPVTLTNNWVDREGSWGAPNAPKDAVLSVQQLDERYGAVWKPFEAAGSLVFTHPDDVTNGVPYYTIKAKSVQEFSLIQIPEWADAGLTLAGMFGTGAGSQFPMGTDPSTAPSVARWANGWTSYIIHSTPMYWVSFSNFGPDYSDEPMFYPGDVIYIQNPTTNPITIHLDNLCRTYAATNDPQGVVFKGPVYVQPQGNLDMGPYGN